MLLFPDSWHSKADSIERVKGAAEAFGKSVSVLRVFSTTRALSLGLYCFITRFQLIAPPNRLQKEESDLIGTFIFSTSGVNVLFLQARK